MPSPEAYRPSNGATVLIDAGIWSATGRPTVHATIDIDARLLMDAVSLAARDPGGTAAIGLGNPHVLVTLTP